MHDAFIPIEFVSRLKQIPRLPMKKTANALVFLVLWSALPNSELRCESKKHYELRGTLLDRSGKLVFGSNTFVQLSGPYGPMDFSTLANRDGTFRFKRIPAGIYVLTAFIPRIARAKRTIEIGPSFVNKKGQVEVTLKMEPRPRRPGAYQVTTEQLSIPQRARVEYEKGLQSASGRDLSRAKGYFQKALDLAPQFSAAWYQLGLIASRENRLQEAADNLGEALRLAPENYQALINLGSVLLAQGKGAEAASTNERAVKARPEDAQAHAQLGYSYLLAGRLKEAEIQLRETVSLDPSNYYYPQILLAEIYSQRGDQASMMRELEEFIRLHPDSEKARDISRLLEKLRSGSKIISGKP